MAVAGSSRQMQVSLVLGWSVYLQLAHVDAAGDRQPCQESYRGRSSTRWQRG